MNFFFYSVRLKYTEQTNKKKLCNLTTTTKKNEQKKLIHWTLECEWKMKIQNRIGNEIGIGIKMYNEILSNSMDHWILLLLLFYSQGVHAIGIYVHLPVKHIFIFFFITITRVIFFFFSLDSFTFFFCLFFLHMCLLLLLCWSFLFCSCFFFIFNFTILDTSSIHYVFFIFNLYWIKCECVEQNETKQKKIEKICLFVEIFFLLPCSFRFRFCFRFFLAHSIVCVYVFFMWIKWKSIIVIENKTKNSKKTAAK